jgi:hypothetical protein
MGEFAAMPDRHSNRAWTRGRPDRNWTPNHHPVRPPDLKLGRIPLSWM